MDKICAKCGYKMQDADFLCPQCGAIWGDPVYRKAAPPETLGEAAAQSQEIPAEQASKPQRQDPKPLFIWLGIVVTLMVLIMLALMMPRFLRDPDADPTLITTQPTSAPLLTYNVQVKAGNRATLKGVLIEVYLGDKMIDSCITSQYGKASFTLPQNDNYRLRLKELPKKYQINYGDTDFTFPKGQQDLIISLENKPIPYIVKVVNEEGEPLPGAGVMFCTFNATELKVTDENGCCVFEAKYLDTGYSVRHQFLPTGYGEDRDFYNFEDGSNELVITLPRVEDAVPEGEALYTVRVVDDYGQPVTDTLIYIVTDKFTGLMVGNYNSVTSGTLNQDGWFAFTGTPDQNYSVWLPNYPDYQDTLFSFENSEQELMIQLDLEREEYTYTVYIVDQYGDPHPGVELFYSTPEGSGDEDICYVSDENGIITITCNEPDPTKVFLYIVEDDGDMLVKWQYRFEHNSRKLKISVYNLQAERVYIVKVQDQYGQPVVGAKIALTNGMGTTRFVWSGSDGICVFDLEKAGNCHVQIVSLPDGYTNPTNGPLEFAYGSREMTLTVISTAEPTE